MEAVSDDRFMIAAGTTRRDDAHGLNMVCLLLNALLHRYSFHLFSMQAW
jgi:hypothetical protein